MARKHPLWKFWWWFGANPAWELIKFIGGTAIVSALWTVMKNEIHRHPVDWILFACFLLSGATLVWVAAWKTRSTEATTPLPEPEVSSQVSPDRLFTPTQLEAFRVAKEIREFVTSSLPRPDVSWDNLDPVNGVAKRMAEQWRLLDPWLLKLRHRYARELAPKVKEAMHLLGEEGFSVSALEPYVNGITNEADAWSAAQVLDHLAFTASYKPWILDTQWRDTVRRYESMTSDQYRAALDIPEFGYAVEEALTNRGTEAMR